MHSFIYLVIFASLQAFASTGGDVHPPNQEICARFMAGTPNTLPEHKAEPDEIEKWLRTETAADIAMTVNEVRTYLKSAPAEVLDYLGLVDKITAKHAPRDAEFSKALQDSYLVEELEIFFRSDLKELAPVMHAITEGRKYLSPESVASLDQIALHPSHLYVLALALVTIAQSEPLMLGDDYAQMRTGQHWLPADRTLKALLLSTPARTEHFVRVFYQRTRPRTPSPDLVANDNPVAVTTSLDNQALSWVSGRLYERDSRPDAGVRPEWNQLLKQANIYLRTPVSRNPRFHYFPGVTINLSPFVPDDAAITHVSAATLSTAENVVSGRELPEKATYSLREVLIQRLRLFFPAARLLAGNATAYGPLGERELPAPPEGLPTAENDNRPPSLLPFATNELPLDQLKDQTVYRIQFKKEHANFRGPQNFKFVNNTLENMRGVMARTIPPLQWLEAIYDGIARAHGQSGIKLLKGGQTNGALRFEVKLTGTPWRIYGHLINNLWLLEEIGDEH